MSGERFLVTGGTGCIGSWVVRNLVRESVPVAVLTAGRHFDRLRLILTNEEFERIAFVDGDVADVDALEAAGREHAVDTIVHLAALQMPFCAANPMNGARVNVLGTVAVFEAARRLGVPHVVYASSAAVYGPKSHYRDDVLGPDAPFYPTSHYGAFKVANEHNARAYWQSHRIASIGLRPHSVYGPGRDQGVTSRPTLAMIAAAAGRSYRIDFGGRYQFQFADDVARTFICAARSGLDGARAYSLGGPRTGVAEIVETIERVSPEAKGRISQDDRLLALPEAFDGAPLERDLGVQPFTELEDGVRQTIDAYRAAIRSGLVDEAFLGRVVG